jgi:hypothetical protein
MDGSWLAFTVEVGTGGGELVGVGAGVSGREVGLEGMEVGVNSSSTGLAGAQADRRKTRQIMILTMLIVYASQGACSTP